jgi:polysaccharide export outer membrane protein
VSVIQAGKSVRMPLTARGERVLDAVAAAGGVAERVQDVSVQLTRGELVRTVPFERLLADGRENVLLHSHDVVTLLAKPMSFTALGAVAKPQQIGFAQGNMSLSQALGQMGGLLDRRSDAKGVFVFRYEPLAELPMVKQEQWLAKGYDRQALIPVAYRVNLLDVGSLLRIQRFEVKNKDIVYVANAPLSEFQKFMQIVFLPVIGGVSSADNIGN